MISKIMFSSKTDQWATPDPFFKLCQKRFGDFDLDPAADEFNAKASRFFTVNDNGLKQRWFGRVWCNPPYGREIGLWVKKAFEEHAIKNINLCVMLLPSRTDTRWFHDYCLKAGRVEFIKGRLKFGDSSNSAPFPSILWILE